MKHNTFFFFDDKNILYREGLERRYGKPVPAAVYRDPNAVTSGGLPSVWHDTENGLYHLFYNGFVGDTLIPMAAVSRDGIHFEPRCTAAKAGITDPLAPNQLLDIRGGELAYVYTDETAPPEQRLKALMTLGDGTAVRIMHDLLFTSGDGVHWQQQPVEWHNHAAEPSAMCFYNDITKKHSIIARMDAGVRRLGLIETDDFRTFTDARMVMTADSWDEPLAEHYGMPTFPYKGWFIGFLWIYHAPNVRQRKFLGGTMDAQLVYSYNGTHFNRSLREPFFSNDALPETAGMVMPNMMYENHSGQLLAVAATCPYEHGHFKEGGALVIYELRPDGFIAFHAQEKGELVTIPMVYQGGDILINAAAEEISCALYTDDSREEPLNLQAHKLLPLEGFEHEAFLTLSGDRLAASLQWENKNLNDLRGRVIYLELRIKNGDLYSVSGALTPMMICDLARYHLYGILPDTTGIG